MEKLVVRPKPPKGEDGYRVFSIRVRKETLNSLEEIVKKTGWTRNELICQFLEYALKNCVVEEKKCSACQDETVT